MRQNQPVLHPTPLRGKCGQRAHSTRDDTGKQKFMIFVATQFQMSRYQNDELSFVDQSRKSFKTFMEQQI